MEVRRKRKLVYIITNAMSARYFLVGQLGYLRKQNFDVTLISSPSEVLERIARRERVAVVSLKMEREPSVAKDLVAFVRLVWTLKKIQPDIVNASTPKAGMLGMLASFVLGIPLRVYVLRGLRLETTTGLKRWILRWAERLSAWCAHRVICNSESLRNKYVQLGFVDHQKTCVLEQGSSNGVEAGKWRSNELDRKHAVDLQRELGINPHAPVVGFVGRLTQDKGVVDLYKAFQYMLAKIPNCQLVFVGDFEKADTIPNEIVDKINDHPAIFVTGFVEDPRLYYQGMDLVAFPSYREGLPNVPLEAAASGLPVVGFRATGTVDSVCDGVTGRLVSICDANALANAMIDYIEHPELRRKHGAAGRAWVSECFCPERVWKALLQQYESTLGRNCGDRVNSFATDTFVESLQ